MRRLLPICVLGLLAISGCTGSSGAPVTSASTPIVESASPTAPSTSASPTETPSLRPTVTASVAASPAASLAAAECTSSQLQVTSGRGGGAAGTFYQSLVFTNISSATCSLRGYPGASFVDSNGHQLGYPADRDTTERARRVVLASGAKAHALLGTPEAVNFSTSDCEPQKASGVRVYPPDQTAATVLKVSMTVCTTHRGRSLIQPIRPGTRG